MMQINIVLIIILTAMILQIIIGLACFFFGRIFGAKEQRNLFFIKSNKRTNAIRKIHKKNSNLSDNELRSKLPIRNSNR